MKTNIKITFLILVIIQGIHSIEEYFGKLWDVFQPAKILSGLVSNNLEKGFLIINTGLFIFGIWCWIIPIRKNYSIAKSIIWFWIFIEMINGIGHPIWAVYEKSYVPGVATAPILLILSVYLFIEFRKI
jgi:hypothetical protein